MNQKKFGLSGTALKWIAMITMTIDHTAGVLVPFNLSWSPYLVMRLIGRLAFPIYVFLLVEGFHHTKNRSRYALRLGLFALISEIPFNLAVGGSLWDTKHQNVFITLLLGLLMLWLIDVLRERWSVEKAEPGEWYLSKIIRNQPIRGLIVMAIVLGFMVTADFLNTDYHSNGIMLIALIGFLYPSNSRRCLLVAAAAALVWFGSWIQMAAAISFVCPVALYNGTRGKTNRVLQWIFYLYYPIHLTILVGVKYLIMG